MATLPLAANLPADLPENWTLGEIVSPNGTEGGLTSKHGYNYLSGQINECQTAVNTINAAFADLASTQALNAHINNVNNPHGVTAAQAGAVSKNGDTMTGDLIIEQTNASYPYLYLRVSDLDTTAGVSNWGNALALTMANAENTSVRRILFVRNANQAANLSDALAFRDYRLNSNNEIIYNTYKVLHTGSPEMPANINYDTNRLRNIQLGTANTPTNALVNGSVYLQYK